MLEEIELWATKYSWEELNPDQQILVGNHLSKKEYDQLHARFKSLRTLESPSDGVRGMIMSQAPRRKSLPPILFITGMAASLLIGLFMGSMVWDVDFEFPEVRFASDTIKVESKDTIYLTKIDTVYREKTAYKKIKEKVYLTQVVQADCEETPLNLAPNYKVPMPNYVVELPKKEVPSKKQIPEIALEKPTADILSRPR